MCGGAGEQDRLLTILEQLLAIDAITVREALEQAADLVAQALRIDKVDVFLHDPSRDQLVALGVSDTPMGRRERDIGMDVLPLDVDERIVQVFRTGVPYQTGRAERDPAVSEGFSREMNISSILAVPLYVAGERRGVLAVDAAAPDMFAPADLRFLEAVAHWVGMVMHRAELAERVAQDAAAQARRSTEEAQRARLEAVLEQMPIGVAIAEAPSGRLLFHNAAAIHLIGHPLLESADYTGYGHYGAQRPSGEPYAPDEYPIARALLQGVVVSSEEMLYRRGDGALTVFEVTGAPIRDATGAIVLAVSTFEDISERKRIEQEREEARAAAEAAVRVRDDFLSSATHDLRSPLAALQGRAQLLRRRAEQGQVPDEAALLDHLSAIEGSVRRMLATVNELGDVARLQIGEGLALDLAPVDLGALARVVVEEAMAGRERTPVTVDAPAQPVVVEGDGPRLRRVLQNIVDNAVKYSTADAPIDAVVRRVTGGAAVVVRDRGVGIPAADLSHVFERYYRASTARGIAGNGLGLWGAKAIVEQHGGTITVESAVGQGTTVTVSLPASAPSATPGVASSS